MKRYIKLLLLLLSVQLVGCGTYTAVRENPDFATAKRNIETVAVLPSDVEITYIVFNGDNERMRDKEAGAAKELNAAAQELLQARNYTVKETNFETALAENSEMAFDLTQLKAATKTAVDAIYDQGPVTLEQPKYFTKTVGAAANPFSEYAKADALLLINYSGFEKSSGMITKDIVADVLSAALTGQARTSPTSGAAVAVTLVDGTSGDILWTNIAGLPGTVAPGEMVKGALAGLRTKGVAASIEQPTQGKRQAADADQAAPLAEAMQQNEKGAHH